MNLQKKYEKERDTAIQQRVELMACRREMYRLQQQLIVEREKAQNDLAAAKEQLTKSQHDVQLLTLAVTSGCKAIRDVRSELAAAKELLAAGVTLLNEFFDWDLPVFGYNEASLRRWKNEAAAAVAAAKEAKGEQR